MIWCKVFFRLLILYKCSKPCFAYTVEPAYSGHPIQRTPGELALFAPIILLFLLLITLVTSNVNALIMMQYIVATNVDRDFIEPVVEELANKNIIFNKPTVQGLDSCFIVNAKENS